MRRKRIQMARGVCWWKRPSNDVNQSLMDESPSTCRDKGSTRAMLGSECAMICYQPAEKHWCTFSLVYYCGSMP